jgi:hypothetical protein
MGYKCFDKRQMQIDICSRYQVWALRTTQESHKKEWGKKKTHESSSCNNAKGVPSSLGRSKLQTPNFPSIIVICLQFYWLVLPKERERERERERLHKVNDVVFSFGPTI